ncbi:ATP-dependent (S)-NAD(P)H-hydrate dehydratase [Linum perenne]
MLIRHGLNQLTSLSIAQNSTFAHPLAALLRRHGFLISCLRGIQVHTTCTITMQESKADAETILRAITPTLDPIRYKGQADLSHVFCTKDAAPVIKSYSPELIVHPVLEESYSVREEERSNVAAKVVAEVDKWMERFDCLVIGPGLGRDPFLLDCVSAIMRQAKLSNVPIVVDGDGLFLITNSLDLVRGYPLAVLTPNVNEYKRLVQKVLGCEVNDADAHGQLLSLSKHIGGVTILRKGRSDLISDGEIVKSVSIYGSPRRCGGQGDILSGSVAVFLSWARQQILGGPTNPAILGCIAGSALLRRAASLAFENRKRSTLTSDIIECLGKSLEDICPASHSPSA